MTKQPEYHKAQLVSGDIKKTLFRLTLPMIFGILGMVAFNLIDTFFIGQLGTNELAAISFTFPVIFVISGISMGLGVGASAVISRAIGSGDQEQVKRLTTDSIILAVLTVAVFISIGLLTIDPIFRLLGADDQTLLLIRQYMIIWYPGMIFVVIPMVGNNAIRATGDTKTPSIVMLTAVVVNSVLDPLLIFGIKPFPRLELAGAAIATVAARAVTLVVSLYVLHHREKMITFKRPPLHLVFESWKKILYIGLPTAGTNIIMPVGAGIITRLVASYGTPAVAALGVSMRVEMFALTVVIALASVLGPFIGQNRGAQKFDRVRKGITYSQNFGMIWGLAITVALAFAAKPIAMVFNNNPDVISATRLYLWIVPVSYGLHAMIILSNSALNVLNKPLKAAALTGARMFALYIPLSYLGSYLLGLTGIFSAISVSNIIIGIIAWLWLKKVIHEDKAQVAIVPQNQSPAIG